MKRINKFTLVKIKFKNKTLLFEEGKLLEYILLAKFVMDLEPYFFSSGKCDFLISIDAFKQQRLIIV